MVKKTTTKKAAAKPAAKDQAFNAGPKQKGKYPKGGEPLPAALAETAKGEAGPVTKLAEPQPAEPTDAQDAEHRAVRRANFGF